jgi:hypothetical protein
VGEDLVDSATEHHIAAKKEGERIVRHPSHSLGMLVVLVEAQIASHEALSLSTGSGHIHRCRQRLMGN